MVTGRRRFGGRPSYPPGLHRRLLTFPLAGFVAGVAITVLTWRTLPRQLVTHWGAGGAHGTMPAAWVVGTSLVLSAAGLLWALADVWPRRRSTTACCESALLGGLFAWLGTACLAASIWSGESGALATVIVLLPVALTGIVLWRADPARAGTDLE